MVVYSSFSLYRTRNYRLKSACVLKSLRISSFQFSIFLDFEFFIFSAFSSFSKFLPFSYIWSVQTFSLDSLMRMPSKLNAWLTKTIQVKEWVLWIKGGLKIGTSSLEMCEPCYSTKTRIILNSYMAMKLRSFVLCLLSRRFSTLLVGRKS